MRSSAFPGNGAALPSGYIMGTTDINPKRHTTFPITNASGEKYGGPVIGGTQQPIHNNSHQKKVLSSNNSMKSGTHLPPTHPKTMKGAVSTATGLA
jgi:hypothetical protein